MTPIGVVNRICFLFRSESVGIRSESVGIRRNPIGIRRIPMEFRRILAMFSNSDGTHQTPTNSDELRQTPTSSDGFRRTPIGLRRSFSIFFGVKKNFGGLSGKNFRDKMDSGRNENNFVGVLLRSAGFRRSLIEVRRIPSE